LPALNSGHANNGQDILFRLTRTPSGGSVELQFSATHGWTQPLTIAFTAVRLM
jgi:hypothetical protein